MESYPGTYRTHSGGVPHLFHRFGHLLQKVVENHFHQDQGGLVRHCRIGDVDRGMFDHYHGGRFRNMGSVDVSCRRVLLNQDKEIVIAPKFY